MTGCELILRRGPCAQQPRILEGMWFSFDRGPADGNQQIACRQRLLAWQQTCGAHAVMDLRLRPQRSIPHRTAQSTELAQLKNILRSADLEGYAAKLASQGLSAQELRRLPSGHLDLLAAGQLGLGVAARRRFVQAFTGCLAQGPFGMEAPHRAACMTSSLDVATSAEWRARLEMLRQAAVEETAIVTSSLLSTSTAKSLLASRHTFNFTLMPSRLVPQRRSNCRTRLCQGEAAQFWFESRAQMRQECWQHFERVEKEQSFRFSTYLYLRADDVFMPGTSLLTLLSPVEASLTRRCRSEACLFTPDSWPWLGVNDRMGIMNRRGAKAYFNGVWAWLSQQALLDFTKTNAEKVLGYALNASSVRTFIYPTLSAVTCCSRDRSSCWNSDCSHLCFAGALSRHKYRTEAERAATNAAALWGKTSCLSECGEDRGLCLRPAPLLPWEWTNVSLSRAIELSSFFWVSPNAHCAAATKYARPPTSEKWAWGSDHKSLHSNVTHSRNRSTL